MSCGLPDLYGSCVPVPEAADPARDCPTGKVCDGEGGCAKLDGEECEGGAECLGGRCVDGVCCDSACDAPCHACDLAGSKGACSAVGDGSDPDDDCSQQTELSCGRSGQCWGGQCAMWSTGTVCAQQSCVNTPPSGQPTSVQVYDVRHCDGDGNCRPVTSLPGSEDCSRYACNASGSGCRSDCNDDVHCRAGNYCATNNTCQPKEVDGWSCTRAGMCQSGYCVDGVCCDKACSGTCRACNKSASVGTCTVHSADSDPEEECSGTCKSCNGSGACANTSAGIDPESDCGAQAPCGRDGTCNGADGCRLWSASTVCQAQTCGAGVMRKTDYCNGWGTCVDAGSYYCDGNTNPTQPYPGAQPPAWYACSGNGCRSACSNDSHCGGEHVCADGECGPDQEPPGPPSLTGTTPQSPSPLSTTFVVHGTAEPMSTVRLYTEPGCTGEVAAEGEASSDMSFDLQVSVGANSATTFHATATDAAGNTSSCSQSSVTCVHDDLVPAVVLTGTDPPSPGSSVSPRVEGTTEPGAEVSLYTVAGCTGPAASSGAADASGAFSLAVTVSQLSTTAFYGRAVDAAGNMGSCTTVSLEYVHDFCGSGVCVVGETASSCAADCLQGGYAYVHPGQLTMGSPKGEPGRSPDEGPQRAVRITRGFWLKVTEVTHGEWDALLPEMGGTVNPSYFSSCGAQCPVERVNWWEALAFCNALSRTEGLAECYTLTGCNANKPGQDMECTGVTVNATSQNPLLCQGYRLPTEAEWEHAARAGTTTALYNGPITNTGRSPLDPKVDSIGWYGGNSSAGYAGAFDCDEWFSGASKCGPQPVGRKSANDLGLRDMSGNVWEWAWEWYDSGHYQDRVDALGGATDVDPLGASSGTMRAIRGGSWYFQALYCRSAFRGDVAPGERGIDLGLRPARTAF